jgi:hypothetical protein
MTKLLALTLLMTTSAFAEGATQEVSFPAAVVTATPIAPVPWVDQDVRAIADSTREAQSCLDRYQAHAQRAVMGQILTTRVANDENGRYEVVSVLVEETYRSTDAARLVEFKVEIPLGSRVPGEFRPEIVVGYKVLVFLDDSGWLMDGDAIFAVEGQHAFRKRRDTVFSRPSIDRDWVELTDPTADWLTLELNSVANTMAVRRSRAQRAARRRLAGQGGEVG